MSKRAILYSFRRYPYAIRTRLTIASAGVPVTLRAIRLHEKPIAFLALSPLGTGPCLSTEAEVLDKSLDIMSWALGQNDPARWLQMRMTGHALISDNDGPLKSEWPFASRNEAMRSAAWARLPPRRSQWVKF